MLKVSKMLIISLVFLGICACTTTKISPEENEQRIKTAKINAQLGIAYLERHNISRAKQKLLLSLKQAPDIPESAYSMAYFMETTGNKQEAKNYYLKAIAIAPKRGDAHNNYGTFLCRSGRYQEAIGHFLLAVKDPTYLDPADAYENAGLCALKIPKRQEAMQYFQQALAQDPAKPTSLLQLAKVNYQLKNYKQAKQWLSEFSSLSYRDPEATKLGEQLENQLPLKQQPILTRAKPSSVEIRPLKEYSLADVMPNFKKAIHPHSSSTVAKSGKYKVEKAQVATLSSKKMRV